MDTLISVDVASPGMLPQAFEQYRDRIALRIDHHASATSFTREELVEPEAGACGEIIYDLLCQWKLTLDEQIGVALYVAVSTDTGGFRYANTTAHTFQTAAACVAAGASVFPLNQQLFETSSLARLRMQGWMAEHMRFSADGRIAVCAIPKTVEQMLNAGEDDLDNISGFPRTIAGVQMAATLREDGSSVKLSVRSAPGYDASAVCARFGGGGHKGAAGATIALPLEEAVLVVERAMLEEEQKQ